MLHGCHPTVHLCAQPKLSSVTHVRLGAFSVWAVIFNECGAIVIYKLSNRRAIGEHTSTAVNCIPPAEVALNLAFGDFERNGDIYGHWGRDEGVE